MYITLCYSIVCLLAASPASSKGEHNNVFTSYYYSYYCYYYDYPILSIL